MEDIPKSAKPGTKWLKLAAKILISGLCLWYVSGKIDFSKAAEAIRAANWLYLVLALLLFIASKLVSAVRLNLYFNNTGLRLTTFQNLRLYSLGMFYNLLLPGSISGDAYKVILLKRKYDVSYKKTSAAVLLDRFSGLLGLGLVGALYSVFVIPDYRWVMLIISGAIVAVVVFYYIIQRWFKDFIPSFFSTLLLGILVQVLQVICTYLIMAALHIPSHVSEYIFIFLVSSVVSVLPLTIGGLGIREIVFLEGSRYFGLAREVSVVISLLFYLITVITSLAGIFFVFKDPLAQKNKDPLLDP